MFEADWIKRKLENTTKLKIPVSYGDVIPIRCVSGYENTTFYGLDNVTCYSK